MPPSSSAQQQQAHGIPYPDWPAVLGDPRLQLYESIGGGPTRTRAEIVAQFRQRRPDAHAPVSGTQQLRQVREQLQQRLTKPQKLVCSFEIHCRRAPATRKCHQCVKFDPLKLGLYCEQCFEARHPPYRMEHAWVPVEDVVDPDANWMAHITRHNLEQDAQELQLLLQQTRTFLQSTGAVTVPSSPAGSRSRPTTRSSQPPPTDARRPKIDFDRARESLGNITSTIRDLIEEIHKELARKPGLTRDEALVKIQSMWRIRRARKQLKALLQSVYQRFEDPTTGQTYYYNTRTQATQWTKPKGLGRDDELPMPGASVNQREETPPRKPRPSRLAGLETEEQRRVVAACCIQGMFRAHAARRHFRRLLSSVYEKIWDAASGRFYYHNVRTREVKWAKPRWVDDDELLTPRRREARAEEERAEAQRRRLAGLRAELTPEGAACMVQRAYHRRRGFATLLRLCQGVYERIFDPEQQRYYYHNTRTREVTWDKPALLRRAAADVFTPRTRQKQQQQPSDATRRIEDSRRDQPRRVPIVWTEELAATRLQGLFRARQARRALDHRLLAAYRRVWDAASGEFYYANLQTGAVSWDRPALLQRRAGLLDDDAMTVGIEGNGNSAGADADAALSAASSS